VQEMKTVQLSQPEARIALQALHAAVGNEHKAIEVCGRAVQTADLRGVIRARQRQIERLKSVRARLIDQLRIVDRHGDRATG
jgi:hypothetical protein